MWCQQTVRNAHCIVTVTAPAVVDGIRDHAGARRIEVYIPVTFQAVAFGIDHRALDSTLPKESDPFF